MRRLDPLADLDGELAGSRELLAARAALHAGNYSLALTHAAAARHAGIPAEAAPHALVIEGCALIGAGRHGDAISLLLDGWRRHPDVAALPSLLGLAQYASGEHAAAARSLYAALVEEDPDGTVATWRALLTSLRGSIGMR